MRLVAVLASASCLAALAAVPARADGDPASDYLLQQKLFVPFDGSVPTKATDSLAKLLADSAKKGYEVRVALISSPADLGSVTSLWRQPQRYAEFLGQELYFVYNGRLLVVMPNGYGVSEGGKPVAKLRAVLDGVAPPAGGGAVLAAAGDQAVRRLAASGGVELATDDAGSGATCDRITIAAVGLAVLALAAALWL